MSKKVLYLHIGWSKTGTSAIQAQLDQQFEGLKSQGILYSKAMQMNDHAHHHFALAFSAIHGYPAKYTIEEVIDIVDNEMLNNRCESLLISTELSPFYFNDSKFCNWIKRFDEIKIIATVRRQSELLLSLFNQLVKDPQVRYKGTFYQLAISHFPKVNFFSHITRWASKIGDNNIVIINYDNGVVAEFLKYFSLDIEDDLAATIVNPSLPNSALTLLQKQTVNVSDASVYQKIRDDLVDSLNKSQINLQDVFIHKGELQVIDNHFKHSNDLLASKFLNVNSLFNSKNYTDIMTFKELTK